MTVILDRASTLKAAPLAQEIDWQEPFRLAAKLRQHRHLTFLDSSMAHQHLGRYCFVAVNPRHTLEVSAGVVRLDGVVQHLKPFKLLEDLLAREQRLILPDLPPFQGGVMGYIAYDYGRQLEPQAKIAAHPPLCPDMQLHVYDTVIGFDLVQSRAWIFAPDHARIAELELHLQQPTVALGHGEIIEGWRSNFSRAKYEEMVARAIASVLDGDIFQANLSQCHSAPLPPGFDALAYYLKVREQNPAPFSAFLDYGAVQIASSSPERLFLKREQLIEARPIKGTRRRDADPARDAALKAELCASAKDRAENIMIVDLLRNDLSRVCDSGSVTVPILCGLETYAGVHHLTSVITGRLAPHAQLEALLSAVFPGGSITGAPKIRAMEIIAELEGQGRGVYCGAIGYFAFNGQIDLNIAIRTALFSQGLARVQGGGGITARSDPAAEYEESLTKIERLMKAFGP